MRNDYLSVVICFLSVNEIDNMSELQQKTNEQQVNESLSAFIDAEQPDIETSQIIDDLLNDADYKEQYIRTLLINDHIHSQVQQSIISDKLRHNVSQALDDLPAHFSEDAVSLQMAKTENVTHLNWLQNFFKKSAENKVLSGLSVAASVMFITLFSLQNFNTDENLDNQLSGNVAQTASSESSQFQSKPSLINISTSLPASYVSTASAGIGENDIKQNYQWIEADPALSRQVRQYINEHENRRAAYDLQPKIRTVTFQVNE